MPVDLDHAERKAAFLGHLADDLAAFSLPGSKSSFLAHQVREVATDLLPALIAECHAARFEARAAEYLAARGGEGR